MSYKILIIEGDGIGPEVMDSTLTVLSALQEKHGFSLEYEKENCGDEVKERTGTAVPDAAIDAFKKADSALKGPVGETVADFIAAFRQAFDLYVNIRPAFSYPAICPPALRPDINFVIIRENSEGFYKTAELDANAALEELPEGGELAKLKDSLESILAEDTGEAILSTGVFTQKGGERIMRFAFEYEQMRVEQGLSRGYPAWGEKEKAGYVRLVHKKNIYRRAHEIYEREFLKEAAGYPDFHADTRYIDAMCIDLLRWPHAYSTIVTTNMFGDILSDLTGQMAGGIGMTAGTNFNPETRKGMFEPTHGSAPDIVGTGKADPIGMYHSARMMLEFLGLANDDDRLKDAALDFNKAIEFMLSSDKPENMPLEVNGHEKGLNTHDVGERIAEIITTQAWEQ
ncbi:isocitrate/isopropylmalate family dehydrogenase [Candidatus Altiarchaeota archaeon]